MGSLVQKQGYGFTCPEARIWVRLSRSENMDSLVQNQEYGFTCPEARMRIEIEVVFLPQIALVVFATTRLCA
jgi:hypothetical protein